MGVEQAANISGDILIVDDVPENLSLLVNLLSNYGYQVRPANNGNFAMSSAVLSPPDLILLDIKMPLTDGFVVCETLKADERTKNVPVIFISALNQPLDKVRAFKAGGVDYISKPFQPDEVLARVNAHIRLKKLQESLEKQNKKLESEMELRERVEHIMVHNLKNSLSVIQAYPKVIEHQGDLTNLQKKSLEQIKSAGSVMSRIIHSTLDLLKIEQGEYELELECIDLLKVLETIRVELTQLMTEKNLSIEFVFDPADSKFDDTFPMWGEELLCYNIFSNLIRNAVEASSEDDHVTCFLRRSNKIQITIHNNQVVPEIVRDRFFEKYATADKRRGTGLGTYTAKLVTETMGGIISMETSEDEGTSVYVELPDCEGAEEVPKVLS